MDPLHEELSDFIDRQQIAYLKAITERIMDNEFEQFLKENFKDNMSNYAKRTENESRGVGYAESYTPLDEKVNRKQEKRMRRAAARIVSKRESSTTANRGKEKAPQDISAALDETGWGLSTSPLQAEDMETSRRVNAQEFDARREESNEFKGLGYSSTIANYISHRFKDDTKTAPPKPEKLGRAATKLAVPVLQDEAHERR